MSTLDQERQEIVAALASIDEITAHPVVPDRITPPCVVLSPGTPYLTREDTDPFRHYTARYQLDLIDRPGDNEVVHRTMDDRIEQIVTALLNAGFGIEEVSAPEPLKSGNATYLSTPLTVTTTLQL